jgi:asparagine synthase (glutamine-hydrolysing)
MKKESQNKLKRDHTELAKDLILTGEGAFVFGIAQKYRLILGRDPLGIQPFYFGENETHIVFASNRRILWNLKIDNPVFFPPGQISFVSKSGLKFKLIKNFACSSPAALNLRDAAKMLFNILDNSLNSHTKGLAKCAIAFSGGLDSSLIAFLAKKYVKNLQLIHVSLEDKPEIEEAKKAARILDLPINIYQYSESDIQKILSKVLWLIEDPDPIKLSIGIPFYWTAEKTTQEGFEVLLAGQCADELFGGYKRYLDAYLSKDQETIRNQLFSDISHLHENNLARDMKICNFHGVDLRCPFTSSELVEFALKLPLNLKMERNANSLRKLVLRQVGRDLCLPLSIVEKPKKALQYSTGVNTALKRIAKKNEKTLSEYVVSLFQNQRLEEKYCGVF